jgi:hypothetical protein
MDYMPDKTGTSINNLTIISEEMLCIKHKTHDKVFCINGKQYNYNLTKAESKIVYWNAKLQELFEMSNDRVGKRIRTISEEKDLSDLLGRFTIRNFVNIFISLF